VVAVGALRLAEAALKWASDKRNGGKTGNFPPGALCVLGKDSPAIDLLEKLVIRVEKIKDETHELHTLHKPKDPDGTPLWYVPRSLIKTQEDMLGEMRAMNQKMSVLVKNSED
jgi:hypothetical protein